MVVDGRSAQQWGTYLRGVLFATHPPSTLPREKVELFELLAKTLDTLGDGGIEAVADLLSQEFKSQEMTLIGREDLAREMKLTGLDDITLTSSGEMRAALRNKKTRMKLDDRRR